MQVMKNLINPNLKSMMRRCGYGTFVYFRSIFYLYAQHNLFSATYVGWRRRRWWWRMSECILWLLHKRYCCWWQSLLWKMDWKAVKICTFFHSCGVKKVACFLVGVECCNSLYGPSGHLQAVDCFTDDALIMWLNFHTSLYEDQEISILGIVKSLKCCVK